MTMVLNFVIRFLELLIKTNLIIVGLGLLGPGGQLHTVKTFSLNHLLSHVLQFSSDKGLARLLTNQVVPE